MQSQFIEFVFLILIILGLVMLANKLRIAYPVVLVIGGLALSISTAAFSNVFIFPYKSSVAYYITSKCDRTVGDPELCGVNSSRYTFCSIALRKKHSN